MTRRHLTGVWYRCVELRYLESSLGSAHTPEYRSRFAGGDALPRGDRFPVLYLAENALVSQFEVGALFGIPWEPGEVFSHPRRAFAVINVSVRLQSVADLTDRSQRELIETDIQQLTGDWTGYSLRTPRTPIVSDDDLAPTQRLGSALHAVDGLEAFLTVSARVPYHSNLVVFPKKLQPGSELVFEYPDRGLRQAVTPPRRRRRR